MAFEQIFAGGRVNAERLKTLIDHARQEAQLEIDDILTDIVSDVIKNFA